MRTNFLIFTFLLGYSLLNSQATSAVFSNPTLEDDGDCNSFSNTVFRFDLTVTGGPASFSIYLVDGLNTIFDEYSTNLAIYANAAFLSVQVDPNCGPFKAFVTNDGTGALGEIYSGSEIGAFVFDPSLIDPDCPEDNKWPVEFILVCNDAPNCEEPEPLSENLTSEALFDNCPIENVIAAQSIKAGTPTTGYGAFSDPSFGQIVGDNFTASETGFLGELCWYGFYGRGDWMPDGDDNFTITYYDNMFFENNGGMVVIPERNVPGNIIGGPFEIDNNDITRGPAPFLSSIVFSYTAKHDPVPITMGEDYWVVIKNEITDDGYWCWMISEDFLIPLSTLEWVPPLTPTNRFYPALFGGNCQGCEGMMFTLGSANLPIPTVSEWGLIILLLLIFVFGSLIIKQPLVFKKAAENLKNVLQ